jgi:hypothetical protein
MSLQQKYNINCKINYFNNKFYIKNILQYFCQNNYIMDYAIIWDFTFTFERTHNSTAFRDNECYKNYFFYLFI